MNMKMNFPMPIFGASVLTVIINLIVQAAVIAVFIVLAIKCIQALNVYKKKNSKKQRINIKQEIINENTAFFSQRL